jgi:diguanylate cyclase (GGDEF)-like protein
MSENLGGAPHRSPEQAALITFIAETRNYFHDTRTPVPPPELADEFHLERTRIPIDPTDFGAMALDVISSNAYDKGRLAAKTILDDAKKQEQAKEIARLQHEATHDPLTGLANRAGILEYLHANPRTEIVLLLDGTNFKQVNDILGHARGDKLLKDIADRLTKNTRGGDLIARDGGDEYVGILQNPKRYVGQELLDYANSVRERISKEMQEMLRHADNADIRHFFDLAVGVAIHQGGGGSYNELKDAAEQSMRAAKDQQHKRLGTYRPTPVGSPDTAGASTPAPPVAPSAQEEVGKPESRRDTVQ